MESTSHDCADKETKSKDSSINKSSFELPLNRNQTAVAHGNNALVERIRGVYNSTAVPAKLASTKELTSLGFSFNPTHYQHGYYSKFYRAQKNQDKIIMKTLQLNKLKSMYKSQTVDESCKILEYMGNKEKVPHVVHIYGQFLVDDTLHIFMSYYSERSIHYKMRAVTIFRESLIRQWTRQLASVCKFMQDRGIVHRSIRLEHLLLDQRENLHLTGFTRAIFLLNPHNFQLNKCNREFQCRKKNHLPPEAFVGSKHSPAEIDLWSLGVIIASLSTNRHPFNPKLLTLVNFEQQWQEFVAKHGAKMNSSIVAALNKLFVTQENERIHLADILKTEFIANLEKVKKKSPKKVKPSGVVKSTANSVAHESTKSSKKTKVEVNHPRGSKKSSKAKAKSLVTKSKKAAPKSTKKSTGKSSVASAEKSTKTENVQKPQDATFSTYDKTTQSKSPGFSKDETLKSKSKHQEAEKEIDKSVKSSVDEGEGGESLHKSNNQVPAGK